MILSFSLISLSIILFSLSFSGFGKLFLKSLRIKDQKSFFEELIYGLYLISFLTLICNFFSSINTIYSFLIFFVGLFIYFTIGNSKKKIFNDIKQALILSFVS